MKPPFKLPIRRVRIRDDVYALIDADHELICETNSGTSAEVEFIVQAVNAYGARPAAAGYIADIDGSGRGFFSRAPIHTEGAPRYEWQPVTIHVKAEDA